MSEKNFLIRMISLIILNSSILFFIFCSNTNRQVVVDNPDYKDVRIKKFPIAVQCWTFRKYSFFEALDRIEKLGVKYIQAYPGQILDKNKSVRFDHNLNSEQINLIKKKLKEHKLTIYGYGVVNLDNEQDMEKVFRFAREMNIKIIVAEPGFDDFSRLDEMVEKYNIRVAIHNHPEPSKYSLPQTVLKHISRVGEGIGACGDTGHWMRSGVRPVDGLKILSGRMIDLHLKDLNEFGNKDAYDVPFGQGKANIHDILAELTNQNYHGWLCIEYENKKEAKNPEASIRKCIEYIKSITYYEGYEELLKYSNGRYSKHGWNHYGPGYFELDEKNGILKSHKGMGLFWYSRKKFKDFVLELDFKCLAKNANSGVFLRVPNLPVSDDYIYHSFEIQIYDAGDGIHKTGAVYDAEPPSEDAFKNTGEWNHYKITFKGSHIDVELNDVKIIDWEAEPRGKVKDFSLSGYIGLQNHDVHTSVWFRNIFIKEI